MDPIREILRAHHQAMDEYLDITRCNALGGEDNVHTRGAARYVTDLQFLSQVNRILRESELEQ